jgi:hypothetical protein
MKPAGTAAARPDRPRPFVSTSFKMRLFDIRHLSRDAPEIESGDKYYEPQSAPSRFSFWGFFRRVRIALACRTKPLRKGLIDSGQRSKHFFVQLSSPRAANLTWITSCVR